MTLGAAITVLILDVLVSMLNTIWVLQSVSTYRALGDDGIQAAVHPGLKHGGWRSVAECSRYNAVIDMVSYSDVEEVLK